MKFKFSLFLFFTFVSLSLKGSVPTVEGLFRNPHNSEVSSELLMVKFMLSPQKKKILERVKVGDEKELNERLELEELTLKKSEAKPIFLKLLVGYDKKNEKVNGLVQVTYSSGKMKDADLVDIVFKPDPLGDIVRGKKFEKSLFYATTFMLSANSSKFFTAFLKTFSEGFKTNDEIMNREKVRLFERYKRYLKRIEDKDEQELAELEVEHPFDPEDPKKKKEVEKILKAPMYDRDESLQLIRRQKDFFWKVSYSNFEAFFENENHRLKELSFESPVGEVHLYLSDYVLFNGTHELPKKIIFRDSSQNSYKIRTMDVTHISKSDKTLSTRASEYREKVNEALKPKSSEEIEKIKENLYLYPMIYASE